MRRWKPGPTWSASCSFRRARAISAWRPRACWARGCKGRAGKVALTVDANDDTLLDIVEALKPDMLQLHGKETPERVVQVRTRFGLPVMKALPIAERADLSPIREYAQVADRLLFDARPPKEATRPGGLGRRFDWTLLAGIDPGVPYMLSGGLDAGNVAEALAHHPRAAASTCPPASKARPASRTRTGSANSSAPRAPAKSRSNCRKRASYDRAAAQFLPHRPRRARAFRHLWRPLRRRDADAADPRSRARLHASQGRSRFPEGDGRPSRHLCRPPVAALFRRAAHRAFKKDGLRPFGGGAKSISSARSSTTPARTR